MIIASVAQTTPEIEVTKVIPPGRKLKLFNRLPWYWEEKAAGQRPAKKLVPQVRARSLGDNLGITATSSKKV
jgi:hypothetical protein